MTTVLEDVKKFLQAFDVWAEDPSEDEVGDKMRDMTEARERLRKSMMMADPERNLREAEEAEADAVRKLRQARATLVAREHEAIKAGGFRACDDCGKAQKLEDLITKGDHHGGDKTVCKDRDACHRRYK